MVASQFSVSMRHAHANLYHRRTKKYGKKRVQIPFERIPCSLETKKITLFRNFKSGEILFSFVTYEPAKRTSINRVAGTLETKPITSVNKDEKWPREDVGRQIFIQQDNARTHINQNDVQFRRAPSQDGFDIRLMSQPLNSPDLNILDLGFFSAIQSLQTKEPVKTVDELVAADMKSFEDFPLTNSNRIFLTLQSCMIEILKIKDCNKYKIPHIKKTLFERTGQLPTKLKCDPELVEEFIDYLS
ncbi:hypothetical protein ACP275_09G054300 [Erythranthe tilingii]